MALTLGDSEDMVFEDSCIHDIPLDRYCPDCYAEYEDEYLRQVNLVVDPELYKKPDVPEELLEEDVNGNN